MPKRYPLPYGGERESPSRAASREPRRGAAIQQHRPRPASTRQPAPTPAVPEPVINPMTAHERILEAHRQFRRASMAKHGYFPQVRFRGEEL